MKTCFSLFRPSPGFGRLLVALAPLFLSLTVRAETDLTVIAMTNVWRYNETTNVDGTGWQQRGYDDSAWPAGPGMLGFENNVAIVPLIQTPLQDPLTYTPQGHCVYFRTRFVMPANPVGAVLYFTNLLDDGAVFYLNGTRANALRVTALPPGFTTLANAASTEGVQEFWNLAPTNLVGGENVLAVSVHNSATTGTDLVFGCAVSALIPDPIAITNQPQSLTAEVNSRATFSVGVSGTAPQYQWYRGASPISGSTNAIYFIEPVATSSAGSFKVVVKNTANSVTSSVATLTVSADRTLPKLVSATANETNNTIMLAYSERVRPLTATNRNNYSITNIGTAEQLIISNAQVNANQVRLLVTPWVPGGQYVLTVNQVDDLYTNAIAPNSRIGIGMWQALIASNAFWNWSEGFDLSGQDWTTQNYDESTNSLRQGGQWKIPDPAWEQTGRGLFYFYQFNYYAQPVFPPQNTVLSLGSPTYYFRCRFVVPDGSAPLRMIELRRYIDDGAVVYLNGTELFRDNLPGGQISYQTPANNQNYGGAWSLWPSSEISQIVPGTNVLAVELHPANTLARDGYEDPGIAFGVSLRAAIAPDVSGIQAGTRIAPTTSLTGENGGNSLHSAQQSGVSPPVSVPAVPNGVSNIIQISIDGGGAYWISQYVSNSPDVFPNFYRLQTEGAFTYNARCDADHCYTIPNHTCMLVGRPVFQPTNMPAIQHGYGNTICSISDDGSTIHNYANTNVPYKASIFDVVHDHGGGTEFLFGKAARLAVCERSYNAKYGAPDLIPPDNGSDKIDLSIVADCYADQLVTLFLQNLRFLPPKRFSFLHFVDPDEAGHWSTGGTGWGTPKWSNSIVEMDRQIGRILDAAQHDPALSNRTAIIVTADHGGDGDGSPNHGFPKAPTTFTIPIFLWGPGIPAGVDLYSLFSNRADPGTNWLDYTASPQPLRNGDTGNLALNLLGLPPIPGSLMIPKFAWDEPSLVLHNTNAALVVSWSGYATNFQLEASASLEAAAPWTPVTENITEAGGRFTHAVNAASGGNRFYRLRRITP